MRLFRLRPSPPANGRKPRKRKKNLCCHFIGRLEWMVIPSLNIRRMNINYCPVCGRRIDRDEPCDMRVRKG